MSNKVYIKGVGKYLPDKILTNKDLENMVDTSDKWITTRTGIKQRRIADDKIAVSDMGYEAAKKAISDADLQPEDIDMIIVATITADMFFPSTACLIQKNLGIKSVVAAFDISAACTGFTYAVSIGEKFVKSGQYKNILIVGTEKLSSITDWEDRNTCVLFGDGAGACVLSKSEDGNGILSSYLRADGNYANLLKVPAGGSRMPASHETIDQKLHYLKMEGTELFKVAVRRMKESIKMGLKKAGLSYDDIDVIIPHQANIRILKAVSRAIKVPVEKFFINIQKYGNMSGASTAVALAEAVEEGFIKKGDLVVLVAFGGGLVWGGNIIKW